MTEDETKTKIVCHHRDLTDSERFQLQREIHIENAVAEATRKPPFSIALFTDIGILENYSDGVVEFTPEGY